MFKQEVELFSLILNAVCWIHYYFYSGKKLSKVFTFFLGAIFIGAITEAVSIIVTGSYHYPGFRWYVGPVPIFIALGWGSTFYMIYLLCNELTAGMKKNKGYFLVYGLLAGLFGLIMDLNFDPVSISLNWWEWKNGSAYFGVPIANFIGWFFFCCGFCSVYNMVESTEWKTSKKVTVFFLLLIPVFIITSLSAMPFL